MGTSKPLDSSAAFLFEVPRSNSPLVVQELQIGGTSEADRIDGSMNNPLTDIADARDVGKKIVHRKPVSVAVQKSASLLPRSDH